MIAALAFALAAVIAVGLFSDARRLEAHAKGSAPLFPLEASVMTRQAGEIRRAAQWWAVVAALALVIMASTGGRL